MWAVFCDVFAPMNEENDNKDKPNNNNKSLYDSMLDLNAAWKNFVLTFADVYKLDELLNWICCKIK